MPEHYAIGKNVHHYTVTFDDVRTVSLTFYKAFKKKPVVQLTLNDQGNFPVYKIDVSTTSATIKFKTNWTGSVDVLALERQ